MQRETTSPPIELPPLGVPQWSQTQAIAFEAACECLTHASAILRGMLAGAKSAAQPDAGAVAFFEADISHIRQVRRGLRVLDDAQVAHVCTEFGSMVRRHGQHVAVGQLD